MTVLLPQVCHGRDEPPRVPSGKLVWNTLQMASLSSSLHLCPSLSPQATWRPRPHCCSLTSCLATHFPSSLHPLYLCSRKALGGLNDFSSKPKAIGQGFEIPLPSLPCVLPARSYNESCSPDPTEQGGPKTCCTLDDVPLIR